MVLIVNKNIFKKHLKFIKCCYKIIIIILIVPMAELVDALVSDANDRKVVEVQVLFGAPRFNGNAVYR